MQSRFLALEYVSDTEPARRVRFMAGIEVVRPWSVQEAPLQAKGEASWSRWPFG